MQTCSAADTPAKPALCHAQEKRAGRGGQDAAAKALPKEAHARLEAAVLVSLIELHTLPETVAPQVQHKAERGAMGNSESKTGEHQACHSTALPKTGLPRERTAAAAMARGASQQANGGTTRFHRSRHVPSSAEGCE